MKKFRFRLERVLALREMQENQARMELSAVIKEILDNEEQERQLRVMALESRKRMDEELANPGRVEQLAAHQRIVELDIERTLEQRKKLEEERSRREERYWESRKERRMLEILRDRKKAEHNAEMMVKEAALYEAFHQHALEQKRQEDED